MPTYFARSTKVTLSTASLAKSTDPGPLTHRDAHTRNRLQTAASELSKGTLLKEIPIYTEQDRSHLRFLGEHNDMPFFMVRTGDFHLGSSSHVTTSERSPRVLSQASSSAPCDSVALVGPNPVFSSNVTSTPDLTLGLTPSLKSPELEEEHVVSTPASADRRSHKLDPTGSPASQLHSKLAPEPQALTLTVLLSKASFLRTYDRRLERYITQDVKIDVFFNGELCASTYVPERYRGYANSQIELTQRFSGRRIARLAQRPWILISPEQGNVGFLKRNGRSTEGASAKQRWEALSSALGVEAEKWGQNSYGELPLIGEYLASLAKLEMPSEVEGLQRSGSPNFGVLDVVIISGKGQKDDSSTPYLSEPTRLRVKGYVPATAADMRCDQKPTNGPRKVACSMSTATVPRQHSRTNADAQVTAQTVSPLKPRSQLGIPGGPEGDLFVRPRTPSAASSAVKRRRSTAAEAAQPLEQGAAQPKRTTSLYKTLLGNFVGTRIGNSSFNGSPGNVPSVGQVMSPSPRSISGRKLFTFNTRHGLGEGDDHTTDSPLTAVSTPTIPHVAEKRFKGYSPTEEQPKSKRVRMVYHTVLTNKMTLAEEMAAIEASSKEECLDDPMMTTRSSFASTASTSAPSTAPSGTPFSTTPSSSFDFTEGKVNAGIPFSGKRYTRLNSRGSIQPLPAESAQVATPSTAGKSLKTLAATSKRPRRRPTASATDIAGAGPSTALWPTPALSQDCVITYADGLTRQVKTERNGWFEEKSVLMGVRYLIG